MINGRRLKHLRTNRNNISRDTEVKYVEVTRDHHRTFTEHDEKTEQNAKSAKVKLTPLSDRHSSLRPRQKLTLIKTVVVPIRTYAGIVYGYTCMTNRKKIQRQEDLFLRRAIDKERAKKTGRTRQFAPEAVTRLRSINYLKTSYTWTKKLKKTKNIGSSQETHCIKYVEL